MLSNNFKVVKINGKCRGELVLNIIDQTPVSFPKGENVMAMTAGEIKEWLSTIEDDKMIAIGECGLSLVVKGERSYCEIGGIPLADEYDGLEPGWEAHL